MASTTFLIPTKKTKEWDSKIGMHSNSTFTQESSRPSTYLLVCLGSSWWHGWSFFRNLECWGPFTKQENVDYFKKIIRPTMALFFETENRALVGVNQNTWLFPFWWLYWGTKWPYLSFTTLVSSHLIHCPWSCQTPKTVYLSSACFNPLGAFDNSYVDPEWTHREGTNLPREGTTPLALSIYMRCMWVEDASWRYEKEDCVKEKKRVMQV